MENQYQEMLFKEEINSDDIMLLCDAVADTRRKVAPRSGLQFKVGPQFTPTVIVHPIYTSLGIQAIPSLSARIDRGFEKDENGWIGYKRNYFTLVAAFEFQNISFGEFVSETFRVLNEHEKMLRVRCFAINITSYCCDNDIEVGLIQHTAKRDKGPQFTPAAQLAVPGSLPAHGFIKDSANIRNKLKIGKINQILYYNKFENQPIGGILQGYPFDEIAKVAKYERIQFASTINHRKISPILKTFKIRVELVAVQDNGATTRVAYIDTPPLVIRGRSPSNYKPVKPPKVVKPFKAVKPARPRKRDCKVVEDVGEKARKNTGTRNKISEKKTNLTSERVNPPSTDNSKDFNARNDMKISDMISPENVTLNIENFELKPIRDEGFAKATEVPDDVSNRCCSSIKVDVNEFTNELEDNDISVDDYDTSILLGVVFDGLPKSPLDDMRDKKPSEKHSNISFGTGNTTTTAQSLKRESSGGSNMICMNPNELKIKFSKYHQKPLGALKTKTKSKDKDKHMQVARRTFQQTVLDDPIDDYLVL